MFCFYLDDLDGFSEGYPTPIHPEKLRLSLACSPPLAGSWRKLVDGWVYQGTSESKFVRRLSTARAKNG